MFLDILQTEFFSGVLEPAYLAKKKNHQVTITLFRLALDKLSTVSTESSQESTEISCVECIPKDCQPLAKFV